MQITQLVRVNPDRPLRSRTLELGQVPQRGEINVIGAIDRLRLPEDPIRHGHPPPQLAEILDVVHEQRGRVQHPHHLGDDPQRRIGDPQPGVEGRDELLPDVLARVIDHVVVRPQQDLLLLRRPGRARLVDRRVRRLREVRDGGSVGAAAAPAFVLRRGAVMRLVLRLLFLDGRVGGPVRGARCRWDAGPEAVVGGRGGHPGGFGHGLEDGFAGVLGRWVRGLGGLGEGVACGRATRGDGVGGLMG